MAQWRISAVTLSAATAVDIRSSWSRYELNPVVGRGRFGARQAVTSSAITAGVLGAQWLVLRSVRRHPASHARLARAFACVNFGAAAAHSWVAANNFGHPKIP